MPASEASGYPGQLDVQSELGSVALGGRSHLVYPRSRHDAFTAAPAVTLCLVARDRSPALRATLARLTDASLRAHRVVVIDGGSGDWSLSDAIAHAAHHENTIVYQSPRNATIGEQYAAALELAGSGTAVLSPLHPELAARALLLAPAIALADDIEGAIAGSPPRLVRGERAAELAAANAPPFPLMALRGPVAPPPGLAPCTTLAEVTLALADVLRRGNCVIAELPAVAGWSAPALPLGDPPGNDGVDTTAFWPGVPPLRLGQDGAFTFLLVTAWERARWEPAVATYVRTFTAADPVSLAIVVAGPAPPEDAAGSEILAVIAAARPGSDDDVPDISLHTTPSVLEHLPAIYTGADCLIDAGDQRSALEAMASGLPVIAEATMAAAFADPGGVAIRGSEARRRVVSAVDEQALDRPEQAL